MGVTVLGGLGALKWAWFFGDTIEIYNTDTNIKNYQNIFQNVGVIVGERNLKD